MTVKQIFRDFGEWTSAHGIPHIGSAQNTFLRIFWTIIFLASTGMFVFEMWELIDKYLRYEVTVQTELKFEERPFPSVTICNLNAYRNPRLEDFDDSRPIHHLMQEYSAALSNNFTGISTDDYKLKQYADNPVLVQARASDILLYLAANMSINTKSKLVYSKEEFIQNCAYNTKPCNISSDFTIYMDPLYGACHVFNNKDSPYKSTRAGPLYGLRMVIQSNQSDYLEITESAGVRVTVDNQFESPFPDAFGYNAAAGFTTSFGLKFIQTKRLGQPYGNCTDDNHDVTYFYPPPYSTEGCFRSCFQENIIRTCKCGDPRYNLPSNNTNFCMPDSIECVNNFTAAFDLKTCLCPQPCSESTYGVTVSTALWPSEVYAPPLCKEGAYAWDGNMTACRLWYEQNTMLIEVYYERMNYQLLTESEAYGLVNLISDMGGQLGLWLGFSVITIIEFFALFVLLMLYCCTRSKSMNNRDNIHPTGQPYPNKFNNSAPPPYTERMTPTNAYPNGPRNRIPHHPSY